MSVTAPGPESHVYSPAELNREVRVHLEAGFPRLWVKGEISNLARPASGHLYFTLKDQAAQIRCALFRSNASGLGFQPRNGLEVLLRGRLGLYEPRGDYQLIADGMLEAGEGLLQAQFEALKKKLGGEGLFEPSRKRALPAWPRGIALVTSASGAAVRDMIEVTAQRWPSARIRIHPALVQGETAPASLAAALRRADQDALVDVIILGRGGGSLEDLWAFNDEALARLIAQCQKPVISAVGHETDFTIADFVADLRAPTPSAAAAAATPDGPALRQAVARHAQRLRNTQLRRIEREAQGIDQLERRLQANNPARRLQDLLGQYDALQERLVRDLARQLDHRQRALVQLEQRLKAQRPDRQIGRLRQPLDRSAERLHQAMQRQLSHSGDRIHQCIRALNNLNPLNVLERGYAVVRDEENHPLTRREDFTAGQAIQLQMQDFEVQARVESVKKQSRSRST